MTREAEWLNLRRHSFHRVKDQIIEYCVIFSNVRIRKMNADCISEYEIVFAKTALGIVPV